LYALDLESTVSCIQIYYIDGVEYLYIGYITLKV